MKLRILSVMGEALNFGGRRMETIMRVAWLPVVLLLIVNMVTVFSFLSVSVERVISFADVQSIVQAERALPGLIGKGWTNDPQMMWTILAANLVATALLTASFMAPLIRFAGLGERPGPGIIRVAFGADQIRFIISGIFSTLFIILLIVGPMIAASFYVLKYIIEALSQTMASFPDPDSLHTIELVTVGDSLVAKGADWIVNLAVPIAAIAPFALVLWFIAFSHFHPRNRPNAPEGGNPFARGVITLVAVGAVAGGAYWLLRQQIVAALTGAMALGGDAAAEFSNTPVNAMLFFAVVTYLLVSYFNLRLHPYPGVAVCRKSLGLGNTLRVSRGWNIIRLQVILLFIGFILIAAQYLINNHALGWILQTLSFLYQAVAVSTKLVSSGVTAGWVAPVFIWTWVGIKILINLFWTFFSYGVAAGLYGRLYRDSEREETTI